MFPINQLNSLALATGGRLYAADGSDFGVAFESIAGELKKQYVLGFYPIKTDVSNSNNISISVDRKDVVIRTKNTIRLKPTESKPLKNEDRKNH